MSEAVLFALLPIILLIAAGLFLRSRRFLDDGFWPQAERLAYYVLLPSLFIHSLATADIQALPVGALALTLILSILVVSLIVVALRPLMGLDGPAFTSVFQGSVRFNNYVGVTLAGGVYGAEGVALAAICNAAIVPTVNILCVMVFARHGSARLTAREIARQLVTNPLVIGSLAGICLQLLGIRLPPGVGPAMAALGAAALPLGLLCVGAALDFRAARSWIGPVAMSSTVKFLAMPIVTAFVAVAVGLSGQALVIALMFQALPTASSAYILSRQLGGDAPLMAGITATQTVLALVAVPTALIGITAIIGV